MVSQLSRRSYLQEKVQMKTASGAALKPSSENNGIGIGARERLQSWRGKNNFHLISFLISSPAVPGPLHQYIARRHFIVRALLVIHL